MAPGMFFEAAGRPTTGGDSCRYTVQVRFWEVIFYPLLILVNSCCFCCDQERAGSLRIWSSARGTTHMLLSGGSSPKSRCNSDGRRNEGGLQQATLASHTWALGFPSARKSNLYRKMEAHKDLHRRNSVKNMNIIYCQYMEINSSHDLLDNSLTKCAPTFFKMSAAKSCVVHLFWVSLH